jgi:hypothetical protein
MKDLLATSGKQKRLADTGKFLFAPGGEQGETFSRVARALENLDLALEADVGEKGYDPYNSPRRPAGRVNWYTPRR